MSNQDVLERNKNANEYNNSITIAKISQEDLAKIKTNIQSLSSDDLIKDMAQIQKEFEDPAILAFKRGSPLTIPEQPSKSEFDISLKKNPSEPGKLPLERFSKFGVRKDSMPKASKKNNDSKDKDESQTYNNQIEPDLSSTTVNLDSILDSTNKKDRESSSSFNEQELPVFHNISVIRPVDDDEMPTFKFVKNDDDINKCISSDLDDEFTKELNKENKEKFANEDQEVKKSTKPISISLTINLVINTDK